ncbi:hypothetical protein KIN20_033066 [Parelaphostrongylus tenuis]|uniref:Uncharacterized protein n=1 Tax=Parelaphostrongylus tenuis TaxID=148309 RepID=A0AAD5WIY2_PARTN|nr:hypothetical protein KIN20_033066 [Parelaphostrongylus tenuis]
MVEEYKKRKDDPLLLKTQPITPTIDKQDHIDDIDGDLDMATAPAIATAKNADEGGSTSSGASGPHSVSVSSLTTSGRGNPAAVGRVSAITEETNAPPDAPAPLNTSETPFKS